jgi:hypothetical protein
MQSMSDGLLQAAARSPSPYWVEIGSVNFNAWYFGTSLAVDFRLGGEVPTRYPLTLKVSNI